MDGDHEENKEQVDEWGQQVIRLVLCIDVFINDRKPLFEIEKSNLICVFVLLS